MFKESVGDGIGHDIEDPRCQAKNKYILNIREKESLESLGRTEI